MKLEIIFKGIIIYLVFIVGLAIFSEWLCSVNVYNKPVHASSNYDNHEVSQKLDYMLDSIKNDIKEQYMMKIENAIKGSSTNEKFLNYYPNDNFPPLEEQLLLEETSKRIAASNPYNDTYYPNHLLGQTYLKTVNNVENYQDTIKQAQMSDYKIVNKQINLNNLTDKKVKLEGDNRYKIDDLVFKQGSSDYVPKKFSVSGLDNYSTDNSYSYF
jgi:hypothetical protein